MLLTSSVVPMAKAMIGAVVTVLDNANAKVGIGDSLTAAAKAQTDLQASSNKTYIAMDATYPTRSGAVLTFQVTAGGSAANYVWNEFTVGDGSPGTVWSRYVQQLNGGVAKASGQTWVLQLNGTVGRNDASN